MDQMQIPKIEWDGKEWHISLPLDDGKIVKAKIAPARTYVCRIREAGSNQWSVGFATPLSNGKFVDLKPDTEYEFQVFSQSDAGRSKPAYYRMRTDSEGEADNVIPFSGPEPR